LAYSYFYWKNIERVKRILNQGFDELFIDTSKFGPFILKNKVSLEELFDRCKGVDFGE